MRKDEIELFLQQTDNVKYYPINSRLSTMEETILNRDFHVKYFLTADRSDLLAVTADHMLGQNMLTSYDLLQENFTQFTEETFYKQNHSHYDNLDIQKFRKEAISYFKINPFTTSYWKQDCLVALVIGHKYECHPAVNQPTLHVGYWSYKRDLVNINEARLIKESWFGQLKQWAADCGSDIIDVSIDYFNEPAFRMVFSKGFKIRALRLDRRPTCE